MHKFSFPTIFIIISCAQINNISRDNDFVFKINNFLIQQKRIEIFVIRYFTIYLFTPLIPL